jgi:hypothetical protein
LVLAKGDDGSCAVLVLVTGDDGSCAVLVLTTGDDGSCAALVLVKGDEGSCAVLPLSTNSTLERGVFVRAAVFALTGAGFSGSVRVGVPKEGRFAGYGHCAKMRKE